jgi:esterase
METVPLAYRYFGGEGRPPLVILHGLLGASRNWQSVGRVLAEEFEVFAVDLRNHGDSPHHAEMGYAALARDLEAWRVRQGIDRFLLIGHSLGGKIAMRYACQHPAQVLGLIIADIAPRAYQPHFRKELEALAALDVTTLETRGEAESRLEPAISDWALRKFLLTNLVRSSNGGWRWQCNLQVLLENLPELAGDSLPDGSSFRGPTLFLRGGKSDFVLDSDRDAMAEHFPNYLLTTIPEAGHKLHFDRMEEFCRAVSLFCARQHATP